MAQGLGIRAPARHQPSLTLPKNRFSRSIKLTFRAKAAINDEKNLFIFGIYIYLYITPRIEPELMVFINKLFLSDLTAGLGYTGLAAANYFQQRSWHVSGTVRNIDKKDALRLRGIDAHTFHTDGYEQLR